jgi:hypothetical protein
MVLFSGQEIDEFSILIKVFWRIWIVVYYGYEDGAHVIMILRLVWTGVDQAHIKLDVCKVQMNRPLVIGVGID